MTHWLAHILLGKVYTDTVDAAALIGLNFIVIICCS